MSGNDRFYTQQIHFSDREMVPFTVPVQYQNLEPIGRGAQGLVW